MLNGNKNYIQKQKFSSKIILIFFFQFCFNESLFQICRLWCFAVVMLCFDLFACMFRVKIIGVEIVKPTEQTLQKCVTALLVC